MPLTLRLILGDQLNASHPWFQTISEQHHYLMIEARSETDYVRHHIQKVLGIFAAMRRFAKELENKGHQVHYITISNPENKGTLKENIRHALKQNDYNRFEYQLPDEWRVDQDLASLKDELNIPVRSIDTHHFMTKRMDLKCFYEGKKQNVMEYFYRHMRKKFGILMTGDQPLGGQWNFDASNRKKLPAKHVPDPPMLFNHDLSELHREIEDNGISTLGNVDARHFMWPLDRAESLELMKHFLDVCLPRFGDYQDAMSHEYWSIYHSRLSFSLNLKMISPLELVEAAEKKWQSSEGAIDLSQVEGFIRQIIGWREYMRGIYWWKMPEYKSLNFFDNERPLPSWFWNGRTKMNCMRNAIQKSLNNAYAHHIERLMLTGNIALLLGCDPDEVDAWYLGIYIDAFEWVEITNTRGMSQFADGGIVGTKPYVSGGSYVHKMGDHCKSCSYDYRVKTGEGACPLNSLYWHFHHRHRDKLEANPRIGMMYRTWDKMDATKQKAYLEQAEDYLSKVDYI